MPSTWKELFASWNNDVRDIGNPANAFRVEEPLPEPGLVDVSGMLSSGVIQGIGSKIAGGLARNAYKAVDLTEGRAVPINARRGENFRAWAGGEPTEVLYRGQPNHYGDIVPREGVVSKHNVDGVYFTTSPRVANTYAAKGRNAGGSNVSQVHAKTGKLFDWANKKKVKIPEEVQKELKLNPYLNTVDKLSEYPQERVTQILERMGYKGIRDGDERVFFDKDMYKSVNNSGEFGKGKGMMHATIPVAGYEEIQNLLEGEQ